MAPTTQFRLVTKADAAEIFGVCIRTIENYINEGLLPRPVPFARRDYWHPETFHAFIDQRFKETAVENREQSGPTLPCRIAPPPRQKVATSSGAHPTTRALARQELTLSRLNADPLSK